MLTRYRGPKPEQGRFLAARQSRRSLPALGAAINWPGRSKHGFGFSQTGCSLPPLAFISRQGNFRSIVPLCDQPKAAQVLFVAEGPNMPQ